MSKNRLIVGVTGGSGAPYALNLLGHLDRLGWGVDLVVSPAAATVFRQEIDANRSWVEDGLARVDDFAPTGADVRVFGHRDFMSPIASGSALRHGMVVVPCSVGTLGRLAAGISSSLIERAGDVCLKERRPLVLAVRETPLSLIHLRNMQTLTEAGATILPAAPGFYHRPECIDDLLDQVSGKILDSAGIDHGGKRWGNDS